MSRYDSYEDWIYDNSNDNMVEIEKEIEAKKEEIEELQKDNADGYYDEDIQALKEEIEELQETWQENLEYMLG